MNHHRIYLIIALWLTILIGITEYKVIKLRKTQEQIFEVLTRNQNINKTQTNLLEELFEMIKMNGENDGKEN